MWLYELVDLQGNPNIKKELVDLLLYYKVPFFFIFYVEHIGGLRRYFLLHHCMIPIARKCACLNIFLLKYIVPLNKTDDDDTYKIKSNPHMITDKLYAQSIISNLLAYLIYLISDAKIFNIGYCSFSHVNNKKELLTLFDQLNIPEDVPKYIKLMYDPIIIGNLPYSAHITTCNYLYSFILHLYIYLRSM